MANEAILYWAYVTSLLFVEDYLPDEELKYNIGFVFAAIIGTVVVLNLLLTFYMAIKGVIFLVLLKYYHRVGRLIDPNYGKPVEDCPQEEDSETLNTLKNSRLGSFFQGPETPRFGETLEVIHKETFR